MRQPKLWFYFAVHVVMLSIGLCITIGLMDFLVVPELAWVFTHQFNWLPFDMRMRRALGAIPIGLMMAGMMTLNEWWQRTDAPIMKKIVISAVATVIIMGSMHMTGLGINILFPH